MRVLAIESSCDETAAAVYSSQGGLLSHVVLGQQAAHERFGGVVPEHASREHIAKGLPLLREALAQAKLTPKDIDAVAYTAGPGLVGALLVGATLGKGLACALEIPSLPIHHLEGHLLAPFLENPDLKFPFLALQVSGGHTLIIHARALGDYVILGESVDDAAGEAFDKTARLLGLPYPGGPHLARLALEGNSNSFTFPRPMYRSKDLNLSFSGLKTHVAQLVARLPQPLTATLKADIACAFEDAVVDCLVHKTLLAREKTGSTQLIVAGGVGANQKLRDTLKATAQAKGFEVFYPAPWLCTDNAAMIAYAGYQRFIAGATSDLRMGIKPRWPITSLSAP
ncbi:MAG: tRNA (adenosine(37)-N6)-threonylcarbamoyltransferase complex transferase subunit TsaD [Pseudomonadota bacterium]